VLSEGGVKSNKIAFISYYKNEYSIRTLERKEPLHTAASSDFGAPGPVIDFQAPLQHTLVKENNRKKGTWEKMFLEGRPPVNVGVTNNGPFGARRSASATCSATSRSTSCGVDPAVRTLALSYVICRGASSTRSRATRRRSSSTDSSAACSTIRFTAA
jgi:hypothetical protein